MRYYSAPRRALRGIRQLLYPRRCPFCNAVLGGIRTCPDCAEEVDRLGRKPRTDRWRSGFFFKLKNRPRIAATICPVTVASAASPASGWTHRSIIWAA